VIVVKALQIRRVQQPGRDRFFYSPGVTEPDAAGPSRATIGPHDAPPHAEQVVRRVLLRRNIVIDAATATVQAALQAGAPSRPPRRARVFPPPIASRCSDSGSCPDRGDRTPVHYSIFG
jgi:hypothetical protein